MSQAVLNNSQATGHTDLLSGILKVQVRNEEKITEQDRIYCQNQQDELYKTLDQIAWWYNIFKREAEKYEGKIKLKHEPNGKITTSNIHWFTPAIYSTIKAMSMESRPPAKMKRYWLRSPLNSGLRPIPLLI